MSKASKGSFGNYGPYDSYIEYGGYNTSIGRYSVYKEEPIRLPEKSPEDEFLSEKEALSKFEKACEGCTNDDGCCSIIGLKKAGWDVSMNPTITFDGREGFVLTCLKKATKELTA